MKYKPEIELYREVHPTLGGSHGLFGYFRVPHKGAWMNVICSYENGWDHVSVSLADRCPTWEEMCRIKDLFFDEEETVIQYHPPKSEYVNCHPYCLHLWRDQNQEVQLPPSILVGPKKVSVA